MSRYFSQSGVSIDSKSKWLAKACEVLAGTRHEKTIGMPAWRASQPAAKMVSMGLAHTTHPMTALETGASAIMSISLTDWFLAERQCR